MLALDRQIDWKLLGCCLAVILLSVVTMPWWTVDDAFISYRYGKNLLEAGRLTWNPSETGPVEGYTGVLLPLLAAFLLQVGLPLIDTVKVLGLLAAIGTVAFLLRGLRNAAAPKAVVWLVCLLLAANPLLTMHALSGLETAFFAFFVIGAYVMAREQPANGRGRLAPAWLALMLVLCGLCRPEGMLWATVITAGLVGNKVRKAGNAGQDRRWAGGVVAVALLTAYWIWRWRYYGHFFPNSYHAKRYEGFLNTESLSALGKFLLYYILVPFLATRFTRFGDKPGDSAEATVSNRLRIPALFFLGIVGFMYLRSNLWMNYGSRFFFPYLPLALLLISERVQWGRVLLKSGMKRSIIIGLVLIQLALLGFRHVQERAFLGYYHPIVEEELIPVGTYLREHFPAGTRVASYMDAGALGYFSDMEIVDFGRLNDVYLAQGKPTTEQVINYFFQCDPQVVIMTSWSEQEVNYTDEAMALVTDPRFRAYRFVQSWGNSVHYPYWQRLYVKE